MMFFSFDAAFGKQTPSIPVPPTIRSRLPELAVLLLALGIGACEQTADAWRTEGKAMGTFYSVVVVQTPDADLTQLGEDIDTTIRGIEDRFSTYLPDSEVSRFNAQTSTDWIPVSDELCAAFAETIDLSRQTDGSFDITVAPLVDAWGFGPGEDIYEPLTANMVTALVESVGFEKLEVDCDAPAVRKLNPDMQVDFSAWAKGTSESSRAWTARVGVRMCSRG